MAVPVQHRVLARDGVVSPLRDRGRSWSPRVVESEETTTSPRPANAAMRVVESGSPRPPARPVVVAHRGASGYRPEHTMAGYALALALGADALEVDVVPSADGELVCRHEADLAVSTDIAEHPDLAGHRLTRDGHCSWYVDGLTLEQVRRLRARETRAWLRPDNTRYDDRYGVPTLAQVLDLVETVSRQRGEVVGLYVETKQPSAFAARGLAMEPMLTTLLRERHLDRPNGPVLVQSFDSDHLRRLAADTSLPLVQLVDVAAGPAMLTPAGLREVSTYAGGVALHKDWVLLRDPDGRLADTSAGAALVRRVHAAGLTVATWTLRDENAYLPLELRSGCAPGGKGDAHAEVHMLARAGVGALITDHVDTALEGLVTDHVNTALEGLVTDHVDTALEGLAATVRAE